MTPGLYWFIPFVVGPFVVLAFWASMAQELDRREAFIERWVTVMFVQAISGALTWIAYPHIATLLVMLVLPTVSCWLVGPTLAFFFGPERKVGRAYAAFALAWSSSTLAGVALALWSCDFI